MRVSVFNNQKDLKISKKKVALQTEFVLNSFKVKSEEINIYFVTKKRICELHNIYFKDPTITDCISFPIDSPNERGLLGEIFICPYVALEFSDEKKEIALYLVHGLLHLLGYKDFPPKEKKKMRYLEKKFLKTLEEKNLI